ncbi:MAG: FtsX-like permease family protein, partial [Bacilli bacterium]|nr:FtsX-like permease family protein [Bacilli bacterium]
NKIKSFDEVSVVRYGEGMVDQLIQAFSSIEKITYAVVLALILVTIFLIVNTIKLTIDARKKEISIMRLVGASNISIKTPFVIEGMILGLLGSIIPVIFTTYGYIAFYQHFDGHLFSELIKLIEPEPFIYNASGIVIIIGILVGMVGSAGAVKRYLKV